LVKGEAFVVFWLGWGIFFVWLWLNLGWLTLVIVQVYLGCVDMDAVKPPLLHHDDMPKSIITKKLNGLNYLSLGTCCENLPSWKTKIERFDG